MPDPIVFDIPDDPTLLLDALERTAQTLVTPCPQHSAQAVAAGDQLGADVARLLAAWAIPATEATCRAMLAGVGMLLLGFRDAVAHDRFPVATAGPVAWAALNAAMNFELARQSFAAAPAGDDLPTIDSEHA